jgi:tRNA threonylcarbamoyladenosine biosynthesis protein TsaE
MYNRIINSFLCSEKEIDKVVEFVKKQDKKIILLRGNLASGKTTFVKKFALSLGLNEDVTSSTFSVMNVYADLLYHYDIYSGGKEEFMKLGLLENLEKEGYHIIEWADEKFENLLSGLGFDYIVIEIEPCNNKRIYKVKNA